MHVSGNANNAVMDIKWTDLKFDRDVNYKTIEFFEYLLTEYQLPT